MNMEQVSMPVPDRLELDSDNGETVVTLTYNNPVSEQQALAASKDLVDAHKAAKQKPWYLEG
jgi:hypothetical protein